MIAEFQSKVVYIYKTPKNKKIADLIGFWHYLVYYRILNARIERLFSQLF